MDEVLKKNPEVDSDNLLNHAEKYTTDCEPHFLDDIQAHRFKTEDEWIKYQEDLINGSLEYALSKVKPEI